MLHIPYSNKMLDVVGLGGQRTFRRDSHKSHNSGPKVPKTAAPAKKPDGKKGK
jgi:hypothetical protein